MISVVIPLYNKGPYVRRAIESVLNQTYTDFELVVVDDGSTDGGDQIVEGFTDPRICLIRQKNAGAATARNTGIQAVQGEWVAFLDADDIWLPHNLSMQMKLLDAHPDVSWSAGFFDYRESNESLLKNKLSEQVKQLIHNHIIDDAILILPYGCINTDTVIIKRDVFNIVGMMDATLRTGEDLDLWIRIAIKFPKIAYCETSVAEYYFQTADSLMTSAEAASETGYNRARQFIDRAKEYSISLNSQQKASIEQLCRRLLHVQFIGLILQNHRKMAQTLAAENKSLIGKYWYYMILAKMPTALIKSIISLKKILRYIAKA
jgi:glycosyltransferase involved in cell wall biosynthesis